MNATASTTSIGSTVYGASSPGNCRAGTPATKPHAVQQAGSNIYSYDANGNATRRINGSQDVTLVYDAENRLTAMTSSVTASYVYDGDGNRVKETIGGATRVFVGNTYEVDSGTVKKYYYAGAMRVAENSGGALYYLLTDHLGSTALTLDSAGNRLNTNTEIRYYPYGAPRYTAGSTPKTFNFTGQRRDSGSGLLFYQSRWYDPVIGRFLAADTIVPQPENPQNLNRYSYVGNQPLKYSDPSGHDWVDAVNFLLGFASQWASVNAWMAPQAQEALSVQPNEPAPMTVGRHLGNVAAVVQGVGEMTGGAGLIGGGAVACGTGVLCPAGAPAIVVGAAVAAHGATVAVAGAVMEGQMLGNLMVQAKSANQSLTQGHHPWPKYLGGPKKQPLLDLPTKLHEQYHTGLDRLWSRFDGSKIWSQLSTAEQDEILSGRRDYTQRFDAKNGTATLEALERALKEAGVAP